MGIYVVINGERRLMSAQEIADHNPLQEKKPFIKIKKKNQGKFTASATAAGMSVQAYATKVLSDPNASPKLKKRANFAKNAAGWSH